MQLLFSLCRTIHLYLKATHHLSDLSDCTLSWSSALHLSFHPRQAWLEATQVNVAPHQSVLIVVCQILGAMQVVGVVPRQWAMIVCQMQEALQVEVALYQRVLTACQLLEAMWVEWALCL